MRVSASARFWGKVGKSDGCWPWAACRDKVGYGQFRVGGKMVLAHRFAYELEHGPIPKGIHVLHRCDNPPCCNPAHLFLGTPADNAADKVAKGRQARGEKCAIRGERHGSHTHPESVTRGERSGGAKLTEAQVQEIRGTYAAGRESQAALGRRFGVSNQQVSSIVNGKTWKHLQEEK